MAALDIFGGAMRGVASGIQIGQGYKDAQKADEDRKELGTRSKKRGPGLPAGAAQGPDENTPEPIMGRLAKGGRIKKTGVYRLHKGEEVITARAAKRMSARKSGRRSGR